MCKGWLVLGWGGGCGPFTLQLPRSPCTCEVWAFMLWAGSCCIFLSLCICNCGMSGEGGTPLCFAHGNICLARSGRIKRLFWLLWQLCCQAQNRLESCAASVWKARDSVWPDMACSLYFPGVVTGPCWVAQVCQKMNKARAVRTEQHCSCVKLFSHRVIKRIEGTALDSPMCFLIKASPLALPHVFVGYENSLPMTEQNTVELFFSNGC